MTRTTMTKGGVMKNEEAIARVTPLVLILSATPTGVAVTPQKDTSVAHKNKKATHPKSLNINPKPL